MIILLLHLCCGAKPWRVLTIKEQDGEDRSQEDRSQEDRSQEDRSQEDRRQESGGQVVTSCQCPDAGARHHICLCVPGPSHGHRAAAASYNILLKLLGESCLRLAAFSKLPELIINGNIKYSIIQMLFAVYLGRKNGNAYTLIVLTAEDRC